ncbi:AAA family ATPase [Alicyclobacillus ferrooxydans]|uniref:AAA family ATPase n=1 Tax=Alicyclobacillus ferrooxydans TaxID=471514 RepID=A0A0P9CZ54_9BACL|nr:MoxR family ATPase [Alicyclobacillus ferrooxydans]KPV45016.1 AAA family ATPase [Alicyclobacillus ferrooxydans]
MAPNKTGKNHFDSWNSEVLPVVQNISKVIIGKDDVIRLVFVALLASGHCLIEDVPGVGKTMMVRALAKSLSCDFKRIQFTPDLLPSDVTGVSIYNQKTQEFEFRAGPIFGQIVLADEINRTSPKTQSALLEALEERNVTADGHTYTLPTPFMVLATENPIEFEGTFPLPEAQLDRFLLKFSMGYPSINDELNILDSQRVRHPIENLSAVATPANVLAWRAAAADVFVDPAVRRYLVEIVQHTRGHERVYLGASPRASIALFKASQALAFLSGRTYVVPDDVRYLAPYVLAHRVLLSADARLSGINVAQFVEEVVDRVAVPVLQGAGRP